MSRDGYEPRYVKLGCASLLVPILQARIIGARDCDHPASLSADDPFAGYRRKIPLAPVLRRL